MRRLVIALLAPTILLACDGPKTTTRTPDGSTGTDGSTGDTTTTSGTPPTTTGPSTSPVTRCELPAAPDLDPDPGVVEVALHAAPFAWDPGTGTPVGDGLAFGGQVPGPLIVLDEGQTLRVRYTNDSQMENTLHWHGLRVPVDQDGVTQMADPVGIGETFVYEFVVPDSGFYWYHPHMSSDMELERGLYGGIWVRDPAEPAVDCILPVVVDDLLVGPNGTVGSAGMGGMAMARLGDTLLANGRTDTRTEVPSGASVVFAVVNSANARYFDLTLAGHSLEVVGTDGGWLPEAVPVDSVLIGPGERWLVRVVAGAPGSYIWSTGVVALDDGGMMGTDEPLGAGVHPLWTLDVTEDVVVAAPFVLPAAEPFPDVAAPFVHQWVLDEGGMMMGGSGFTIDDEEFPDVPLVITPAFQDATFKVMNNSNMRHPFHLHGQRFAITAGLTGPALLGWKDTFDVPAGRTVTFTTAADNPGEWMYHCHILDHVDGGMAGMLLVE